MMKQFYKAHCGGPKLAALLRELSLSHNLAIMSRCKREEAREFYLRLAAQERWSFRELERQLAGTLFERVVLSPAKLSAPLRELHLFIFDFGFEIFGFEILDLRAGIRGSGWK